MTIHLFCEFELKYIFSFSLCSVNVTGHIKVALMLTVDRRAIWMNIIVTKVGRSRPDEPLYVLCCRPINVVATLDLSLPGKRQVEKIKLPALGHGDIAKCHMLWNGGDWGKREGREKGRKREAFLLCRTSLPLGSALGEITMSLSAYREKCASRS